MALFSKQKKEKRKGQETTIGKIIYSFLLFMPLLSIAVTCMYAVFNKNAKDSYSDYSIYQQFNISNNTQFPTEQLISIRYKQDITGVEAIGISYISYTAEDLKLSQAIYDTITNIEFQSGANRLNFRNGTNSRLAYKTWDETINFNIIASAKPTYGNMYSYATISQAILTQNKLDNVFTYSIKKVEDNNLYNWSKNTGTYNILHTTTTGLGITNTFIPMLMAYWLIVSVIYFIYDIGLMLVWVMHRKIHELQEEI